MKPLPFAARELVASDFLVTDMTFEPVSASRPHEHELPFVGVVLDGGIEKRLGSLSLTVATAAAYVMPSGVRHVDAYPVGVRLLTVELEPASELWEPCAALVTRVRRLRGPHIASIARQIAIELRADDNLMPIAVEGLSLEFVAAAARSVNGANGRSKAPAWLDAVDAFLVESFRLPLRIADVAGVAHVHPAHLARVFRSHHGETIAHRIRRLRLDWAIGELSEGEQPLRDIAVGAGFAHQSHFNRVFKKHTGSTPAQYRERVRAAP